MRQPRVKPVKKKRTTISITESTHAMGLALAQMERRDFSGMLENAIEERWQARQHGKEAKAA